MTEVGRHMINKRKNTLTLHWWALHWAQPAKDSPLSPVGMEGEQAAGEAEGNWATAAFTLVALSSLFTGSCHVPKSPVFLLEGHHTNTAHCPPSFSRSWVRRRRLPRSRNPENLLKTKSSDTGTTHTDLSVSSSVGLSQELLYGTHRASHRNRCIINLSLALNQGLKSLYK